MFDTRAWRGAAVVGGHGIFYGALEITAASLSRREMARALPCDCGRVKINDRRTV
jgi:hypothetical protein